MHLEKITSWHLSLTGDELTQMITANHSSFSRKVNLTIRLNNTSRIMLSIASATTQYDRKTFILISRCPRGGKTTILTHLHTHLQKSTDIRVMTVSFNGTSGFERILDETPSESLFRLIIKLDRYIGDEPFVVQCNYYEW